MIRLYGHMQGSWRTVSLGLQQAFDSLGVLDGFYVAESQDFYSAQVPGADSPVAVVVGSPMRVLLAHRLGLHKEVWVMLAPNSEGIPELLQMQLQSEYSSGVPLVTGFLAPSTWAQQVLQRTFPDHPVVLCQHGVLPAFTPADMPVKCSVLHMTSSGLSRKCTKELVESWPQIRRMLGGDDTLMILANPAFAPAIEQQVRDVGQADCISVVNGHNLDDQTLADLYRKACLVVQPSRAEGFGLVPLEARACGTPVAMTITTGHADHALNPTCKGCVVIESGPLMDSDDYWGARAPSVYGVDIIKAIVTAFQDIERLKSEAMEVAEEIRSHWTWEAGASAFVERVKEQYGQG